MPTVKNMHIKRPSTSVAHSIQISMCDIQFLIQCQKVKHTDSTVKNQCVNTTVMLSEL